MQDFEKVQGIPNIRFSLENTGKIDLLEKVLAVLRKI